ncbi:peamaclein-like [Cornus florida]|uniref:peamaclein-like n=1 Tax=Cornus florida TaxID=4283 RepID=UPI0028A2D2B0|nr:peamaclein-like [Cornus florida]
MKIVLATLLIASLVLSFSLLQPTMADPSFCDSKCGVRCGSARIPKRCLKYCNLCCQKCSCVPSGTYGNKLECPCYRDMLSSQGTPKCP